MNAIKYSHHIIKMSFSYRTFLHASINLTFERYLFKLYLHIYLLNNSVLNDFYIRTNILAWNQNFYKLLLLSFIFAIFFYIYGATFYINAS